MKSITDLLLQWGQENEITTLTNPARMQFSINGSHGEFSMITVALEKERSLVCVCGLGTFVPEEREEAVLKELVARNHLLKWGAFQLDLETRELTFRACQLLPDDDDTTYALIHKTILLTGQTVDAQLDLMKDWVS